MYHFKNHAVIIDEDGISGGAAAKKSKALKSLEARPNDQYAYAGAIFVDCTYTATETGSATLTKAQQINALGAFSFKWNGHVVFNALEALRFAQLMQQGDEIIAPALLSSYIPTANIAHGAGNTPITIRLIIPLAPGLFRSECRDERTGLVSIAEIARNGEFVWHPHAANLTDSGAENNWSILAESLEMQCEFGIVELPEPVESVYMTIGHDITGESWQALAGDGARLLSCLLFTDDADADMGLPTAFSMFVDGKQRLGGQDGDDWVKMENDHRQDGINDILPAVLPIVTLASRGQLEHCMVVRETGGKVEGMMSGDQTDYGQLYRYTKRLPRETQRDILLRQEIPAQIVDAYLDSIVERNSADRDVGRSIAVLSAAANY